MPIAYFKVMSRRARLWLLATVSLALVAVVLVLHRIPQNPDYHRFADQRGWFAVPSSLNVLSNLPFLVVGVLGLTFLARSKVPNASFLDTRERWPYVAFFLGVAGAAFGSAYYHWSPSNAVLMWDRLPMTFGFMGLLAAVVAECIGVSVGVRLLSLLLAVGVSSVIYWHETELRGSGDLRPYALVQFYPLVVIPLLVLLFPPRYTRRSDIFVAVGVYALAKVFELLDGAIFDWGRLVSGHTLKHLTAALAVYWILRMLKKRLAVESPS